MAAILDIGTNDFSNSDLRIATMLSTKFQLNPPYGSGGDVGNVKS